MGSMCLTWYSRAAAWTKHAASSSALSSFGRGSGGQQMSRKHGNAVISACAAPFAAELLDVKGLRIVKYLPANSGTPSQAAELVPYLQYCVVSACAMASRPSALAVLRLITNSNLVGRSTGRSEGWAPFTILVDVGCRGQSHGGTATSATDLWSRIEGTI
jgi:hypothetical protein